MLRAVRLPNCMRATLLALFALWMPAGVRADWPQFRGPTGQGKVQKEDLPLPVSWGPEENVTWRTSIPGQGWSSPAIAGEVVYLTTAIVHDGPDQADGLDQYLILVDRQSGKIRRQVHLFHHDGKPRIHNKNSHASPTPLVDQGQVFAHFGPQGTACLTLDGDVVWKRQVDYPPVHGGGPSPIVYASHLIFTCDGGSDPFVIALDRNTGETAWKSPRDVTVAKKFSFCTPLVIEVAGQPQVIAPGSNIVSAFDPEDGREIWRVRYEGYSVIPRPVFGHGMVFISTGYDTPEVMAIRVDGQGDVTGTHVVWKRKRGAPNTPSMLVDGDLLYMISDRGVATCVSALDGSQVWQKRIGGNYSASPILADGKIYFQSEQGVGTVVTAGDRMEQIARNDLQERSLASFGVAGGALFIRTAGQLYRID